MKSSIFLVNLLNFVIFVKSSDITHLAFGGVEDAVPAAYGDFNSDELTDIFVIRDDFHTIQIFLG
jgi:integrin alpha FG-GAP repeat containing protein 1